MSVLVSDDDPLILAVQAFLDSLRSPRPRPTGRVSSLDLPQERGIEVETLDLLHACPIWNEECLRYPPVAPDPYPFVRRNLELRERWSYQTVLVAAPRWHQEILAKDLHSQWQFLAYWMCRSSVHWQVIGPPEILNELRGTNGGHYLPWNCGASCEELAASHPLSLFLCQHEIRGD